MEQEWENFKEQVRSAADILEVVSSYVTLKKRGGRYWGCCPLHGEKTPSFTVDPSKQLFYCFGCHAGGDVFAFIRQAEHCGFGDALKLLADRYHIPVPERTGTPQEQERQRQKQAVLEANETACRYFRACLTKMPQGREALAYLAGRGIASDICERFSIGYALPGFTSLLSNLGKRGLKEEVLLAAGLIARRSDGSFYDKFRQRVMIPIKDPRGRIVGFGGRIIGTDDRQAKYMNTAETDLFNKRFLLFAFDVALPAIRASRQAIVVEGYMDAISLHAAGIENVVASMGTAFSREQAKLLQRCAEEVIFCYDSDGPGRAASVRAVSLARNCGLKVRVAVVPAGKDPDEFIRSRGERGKEAFLQVIRGAAEGLAFQIDEVLRQNNTASLAGKVQAVSNILPFLLEGSSEIEAAAYIKELARRLVIDEGLILDEYRKATRSRGRKTTEARPQSPPPKAEARRVQEGLPAEKLLLLTLLERPELVAECEETVGKFGFTCPAYQTIFEGIRTYVASASPKTLSEFLATRLQEDEEAGAALAQIAAQEAEAEKLEDTFADCNRQLTYRYLQKEYERHAALAVEYEKAGDGRYKEELARGLQLKKEISDLYHKA